MLAEQKSARGRVEEALAELQNHGSEGPRQRGLSSLPLPAPVVCSETGSGARAAQVLASSNPESLPLVHVYGTAITCELLRGEVFAGPTPLILASHCPGWPSSQVVQAAQAVGRGRCAARGSPREGPGGAG